MWMVGYKNKEGLPTLVAGTGTLSLHSSFEGIHVASLSSVGNMGSQCCLRVMEVGVRLQLCARKAG